MLTQEEVFVIQDLFREGVTIRVIAQQTGLSPKTVRKYLRTPTGGDP